MADTGGIAPLYLGHNLDLSKYSNISRRDRFIQQEDGVIIRAQVVVQESATDELQITEHPVQQGSVIADHAVKRPAEVRVRMGWSAAYLAEREGDSDVAFIYDRILRLQASRIPFIIYTGKRAYENMLVASIQVNTDQALEYTFMADISFREIIMVATSLLGTGRFSGEMVSRPDKNAVTVENGPVQTKDAKLAPGQWQDGIGKPAKEGEAPLPEPPTLLSDTRFILPENYEPLTAFAFRRLR